MSDTLVLSAEARDRAGKGASRSLRREGRVPAVIYGNNEDPQMVHVEEKLLVKLLGTGHFFNSVVMVEVGASRSARCPRTSPSTRLPTVRCTPTSCASPSTPRCMSTCP